jgi:VCBS repeat-containing protein
VSGTDPDPTTTLMYGIQGGAATATAGQVAQTGSFGTLTLNTATGAYSFAPSAAGINPLQFSASEAYTLTVSDGVATASVELTIQVNVPPPTQLAITTQPSGVVSGVLINPSTVVEIRDSQGNRTANTGAVTVSIDSGTGGALSGALTVNAVNGVATFANLTMTGVLNSAYRLKFSSGYKAASTGGQVEWANVVRNGRGTGRSLLSIDLRQFTGSGINPNQVETIQLLDLYSGPATWIGSDPYWAQFEIQSALSNVASISRSPRCAFRHSVRCSPFRCPRPSRPSGLLGLKTFR